jgi:hypothetical protein|tara:strand:- start:4120 stop:5310 length:1191 start_codon:yes stop_codon:yes gene_type:complete
MNPRSFLITLSILLLPFLFASAAVPGNWASGDYAVGDLVIYNGTTYIASQTVTASQGAPTTATSYWSSLDVVAGSKSTPTGQPGSTPDTSSLSGLSVPSDTNATYSGIPMIARISVRGHVGTADDERFMAFKLAGTASVMVRAVGDALGAYGLTNLMIDPEMRLYKYNNSADLSQGSTEQADGSNDDYGTRSEVSTIVSESAKIFPALTLQSKEAASLLSLTTGYYSNQVFDKSYSAANGSKISWVGVDMTGIDGSASFTSVATRGIVKPGDGAMYAGFEIVGNSSQTRKIFVRGRGPSLGLFGVTNVMTDPQLQLFKYTNDEKTASQLVQLNDNYTSQSNASEIAAKAKSLLSMDLDSKDPGMILDLAPGYYTIQFESVDGATGNGWIGIDDITE